MRLCYNGEAMMSKALLHIRAGWCKAAASRVPKEWTNRGLTSPSAGGRTDAPITATTDAFKKGTLHEQIIASHHPVVA
jgi:hypothetical protein